MSVNFDTEFKYEFSNWTVKDLSGLVLRLKQNFSSIEDYCDYKNKFEDFLKQIYLFTTDFEREKAKKDRYEQYLELKKEFEGEK